MVSNKYRRQFAGLLCKYAPEPIKFYESHYVHIGSLSLQLYIGYHQQEFAGNGHKLAHGFMLASMHVTKGFSLTSRQDCLR